MWKLLLAIVIGIGLVPASAEALAPGTAPAPAPSFVDVELEVEMVDMPEHLDAMANWAVDLFEQAGLDLPKLRFVHHGGSTEPCWGRAGLHHRVDGVSVILAGGSAVAARTSWFEGPLSLVSDPPQCAFTALPSFLPTVVGPAAAGNVAVADFPVLDPEFADWRVGGGEFAIAITDRPEVRAVMEFITSPDFGSARAAAGIGFVPPSVDFDLDDIADPTDRAVAEFVRDAMVNDTFRFGASDLMPAQVGQGSFWFGMVDWFSEGPSSTQRVFAEIEETWPSDDDATLDGLPVGEILEPGRYEFESLGIPVGLMVDGAWRVQHNQSGHTSLSHPDSDRPGDRDLVFFRPTFLADPTRPEADMRQQAPWPLDDIDGWLENLVDGIVADAPERVVIGGREATYFEAEISDQQVCGAFGFCVGFIVNQIFPDPVGLSGWSFEPGFHHRIWWVDGGDEPPLVILATTRTADADFQMVADEVLPNVVIGEPGPHPSLDE